jgi:uncharacterized protein (TIGR00296 family)
MFLVCLSPFIYVAYFSDEEGEWLVRTARRVLERFFETGDVVYFDPPTDLLKRPFGVFTTIKRYPSGELRGCIGYPEPIKPLYRALSDTAVLAATDDPRFPPMTAEELDSVTIEVSALTPPKLLDVPKDELPKHIKVGRDGLIIRYGPYSGLLLPQVPVEEGWDAITFLNYTAMEAGLPPDAWRWPDTDIYTFQAEVFAEEFPKGPVKRVM